MFKDWLNENSAQTDAKNSYYYFILKPFVGKSIGDFKFSLEPMMGTFSFDDENDNAKYEMIYATPYFEGTNGIAIEVHKDPGRVVKSAKLKLPEITGDSKKDSDAYFKTMIGFFKKLK